MIPLHDDLLRQGLTSALAGSPTDGPGAAPAPVRVFILDDHELVRRGMRDLLDQVGGFQVVGDCATAREATARIPALRPDVALLDVQLPDGSGIDVCRAIRAQDPTIHVLMVTSFDDEQAVLAATLAGASGLVLKQLTGPGLVDSIRQVAAGHKLADPDTAQQVKQKLRGGHQEDPLLASLTGQERRILDLIVDGMTNRQIGDDLHIAEKTVKNHVTAILVKLGLQNRTQAAVMAIRDA